MSVYIAKLTTFIVLGTYFKFALVSSRLEVVFSMSLTIGGACVIGFLLIELRSSVWVIGVGLVSLMMYYLVSGIEKCGTGGLYCIYVRSVCWRSKLQDFGIFQIPKIWNAS